jgi:hypothetical protein
MTLSSSVVISPLSLASDAFSRRASRFFSSKKSNAQLLFCWLSCSRFDPNLCQVRSSPTWLTCSSGPSRRPPLDCRASNATDHDDEASSRFPTTLRRPLQPPSCSFATIKQSSSFSRSKQIHAALHQTSLMPQACYRLVTSAPRDQVATTEAVFAYLKAR